MGAYRTRGDEQSWKAPSVPTSKRSKKLRGAGEFTCRRAKPFPKEKNHVRLSTSKAGSVGDSLLVTSVGYDDNDEKMIKDFLASGTEMLERSGCKNIEGYDSKQAPRSRHPRNGRLPYAAKILRPR